MPVGRWIGFALIWVALVVMTIGRVAQETRGSDFPAMSICPHPKSSSR